MSWGGEGGTAPPTALLEGPQGPVVQPLLKVGVAGEGGSGLEPSSRVVNPE